MAKIHLKRLEEKYDVQPGELRGERLREVMGEIIASNNENISRATGRISRANYDKQARKIRKKGKRVILPSVEEVLPKRSVFVRKAAQEGNIITDRLRDALTKNLRETLADFKTKTGEQAFIRRRGAQAGTINPAVIAEFRKAITKTYEGYTKRDPSIGVPKNIRAITVTEIRSTVDAMKHEYNTQLIRRNPNIRMQKRWIQNRSLSIEPREDHAAVDGTRVDFGEPFRVPLTRKKNGVLTRTITLMQYPHDPTAPAEQVINCSCEAEYIARVK